MVRLVTAVTLLLASAILAPTGDGRAADPVQKVRFVHASRSNSNAPKVIAQSKGFFRAEGLEAEMIQMNPRLAATALVSGEAAFSDAFTSVFRGILQGFPIKLVFVHQKKGPYFLIARPELKEIQQLKGKKLGVATLRGSDHLVAEELLQSKGFNPGLLQVLAVGDAATRYQALSSGAVDVIAVGTPHDLMLRQKGFSTLAGPPEVGLPGACVFTAERYLRDNPVTVRKVLKALLRAQRFILENRQETIQALLQWLPQTPEVAAHSYDYELTGLSRDGLMSDAELEALMVKLGDKKRPVNEVRDFSLARQAMKELESGR
jgi:ABC-type nitrate/sulfonate/bicarbonate transport system substrate-binding protein